MRYRLVFIALLLVSSSACTSILRNPVPEKLYLDTDVLGRNDLRFWGDEGPPSMKLALRQAAGGSLERSYADIMHRQHHYLAISGGGANGAYGAGVLVGWSKAGDRPEFTMVTGISTGALTAPFAFLGPEYDNQLQEVYTTLDTSHIFYRRSYWAMLRGDSVVDSAPLARVIDKFVTDELIAEIAGEYRRGRALFIGTTNLDAGRPVIWNIGRIANTGDPGAGKLIRSVLRASASIPGVFPPVYIEVKGPDGRTYEEMHVDGGTSAQLFLYPSNANWAELLEVLDVRGPPTAYLIRNSRLFAEYDPVRARLPAIAARSVDSLIRTQGIGDAYRIAAVAKRDGILVEITWIPGDAVRDTSNEVFDPAYMSALFDYGYQRALDGEVWTDLDLSKTNAIKTP